MRLWKRAWQITVGNVLIEGNSQKDSLDLNFSIEKDIKNTPNSCVLQIYNLSEPKRKSLQNTPNVRAQIRAGYEGNIAGLFLGDAYITESRPRKKRKKGKLTSTTEGADIVTTIEAQDGGRGYATSRLEKSYGDDTSTLTVLRDLVVSMGIGEGNLLAIDHRSYEEGTVVSGRAWRELDRIIRGLGYTWSVQDGVLQVLSGRQPLRQTAIRLAPETGLIGSPAADVDDTVTCTALLIPGLDPGRQVIVSSAHVQGQYRVRTVRYHGDTVGLDWYANMTLERY